ncbi:MAG: type III-A CRISPR-associated protein Csm2 [Deltaproteobacteria bacterium]|nr:type III-A CRISPR-associated protein Csm2 [Deltaproteobacteria bacterium]MBW1990886.1 type III-A CRISPR-associated protein Csm2 [Deltaproteobacteria bacterium]
MTESVNYQNYAKRMEKLEDLETAVLVDMADEMGKELARNLKINQIRRFLDALRKIEQEFFRVASSADPGQREKIKHNLSMLRPKLAYAVGRDRSVRPLMTVLEPAIRKAAADPDQNFEKLLHFMEAIIAYHKYYGGKD